MQMIGSALMTKLWFCCASRAKEERNPVLLVIDEFQNFAFLETLEVMIAEARKFGIGLVLSHQHTGQLTPGLLGEVLGNTATKIIFRVSGWYRASGIIWHENSQKHSTDLRGLHK
jgi:type IV secretory pathway TraG/TraD family ATPase VirD4